MPNDWGFVNATSGPNNYAHSGLSFISGSTSFSAESMPNLARTQAEPVEPSYEYPVLHPHLVQALYNKYFITIELPEMRACYWAGPRYTLPFDDTIALIRQKIYGIARLEQMKCHYALTDKGKVIVEKASQIQGDFSVLLAKLLTESAQNG